MCCPHHSEPYADPYYDYEMEALWRGGQYENFRVQYTEAPLPYHYSVSKLCSVLLWILLTLNLFVRFMVPIVTETSSIQEDETIKN